MDNLNSPAAEMALRKFGSTGLKPDDGEINKQKHDIQEVFELLKKSAYPPDRCIIGGSLGKATAIPGSDIDLVVFVNKQEPPFKNVLDHYESILKASPKILNVKLTKHSVQFQVNGTDIDLLPAQNFVSGNHSVGEQAIVTLSKINDAYERYPAVIYNYSSSLVEFHVLFMKQQSGFIHELVRICKFWSKSLVLGFRISGQSTIIELVATFAGREEEKKYQSSSRSILRAFYAFLEQMSNLETMCIRFDFDFEIQNLKSVAPFLQKSFVQNLCLQKPFLIEPSNPFNNLAKGIKREKANKLGEFARMTLHRMNRGRNDWARMNYFPLELLFEVQPRIIRPVLGSGLRDVLVSVINNCSSKCPKLIIRNESKFKKFNWETIGMQMRLKMALFVTIHAFTSAGKPNMVDAEVKKLVDDLLDRHAYGVEPRGGSAFNPRFTHETSDVTLEIPFANMPKAVLVSFLWS